MQRLSNHRMPSASVPVLLMTSEMYDRTLAGLSARRIVATKNLGEDAFVAGAGTFVHGNDGGMNSQSGLSSRMCPPTLVVPVPGPNRSRNAAAALGPVEEVPVLQRFLRQSSGACYR